MLTGAVISIECALNRCVCGLIEGIYYHNDLPENERYDYLGGDTFMCKGRWSTGHRNTYTSKAFGIGDVWRSY